MRKLPVQGLQGKVPQRFIAVAMMSGSEAKLTELEFKHRVKDENGKEQEIGLSYLLESEGTRRLFAIIGPVIDTLMDGGTLVMDERDTKLHHRISSWLISLFRDPEQNAKGARFIFSTHDQELLGLERLRRDQVWFTEKDQRRDPPRCIRSPISERGRIATCARRTSSGGTAPCPSSRRKRWSSGIGGGGGRTDRQGTSRSSSQRARPSGSIVHLAVGLIEELVRRNMTPIRANGHGRRR